MADISNLTNFLTDIADALRTKKETTAEIPAEQFDQEILTLTTGVMTRAEYNKALSDMEILLGNTSIIELFNNGNIPEGYTFTFKKYAGITAVTADITTSINFATSGNSNIGSEYGLIITPVIDITAIKSIKINGSVFSMANSYISLVCYDTPEGALEDYTTLGTLTSGGTNYNDEQDNFTFDISDKNLGNKYLGFRLRGNHNYGQVSMTINEIVLVY